MSALAPRATQAAPDTRQLSIAVGALTLAAALVVGMIFTQQASTNTPAAPAAAPAQVVHDHGWAESSVATGGITYTGIPYTPTRDTSSSKGPRSLAR